MFGAAAQFGAAYGYVAALLHCDLYNETVLASLQESPWLGEVLFTLAECTAESPRCAPVDPRTASAVELERQWAAWEQCRREALWVRLARPSPQQATLLARALSGRCAAHRQALRPTLPPVRVRPAGH